MYPYVEEFLPLLYGRTFNSLITKRLKEKLKVDPKIKKMSGSYFGWQFIEITVVQI